GSAGDRDILQLPAEETRVELLRARWIVRLKLHVDERICHHPLLGPSVRAVRARVHLSRGRVFPWSRRLGARLPTSSSLDTRTSPRRCPPARPSRRSHTACSRVSSCRGRAAARARAPSTS